MDYRIERKMNMVKEKFISLGKQSNRKIRFGALALFCLTLTAGAVDSSWRQHQLRGYGTFQSQELPGQADGITAQEFKFQSPEKAAVFLSKLYADFELTAANQIETVATAQGPVEVISLNGKSCILPVLTAGSGTVRIFTGTDRATLLSVARKSVSATPLTRKDVSHPPFMDKWDRYPIGVWQRIGDAEQVKNHPGMADFTEWMGRIGLNAQVNIGSHAVDLAACDNQTTWWRRYLEKNHVKYQRVEWLIHHLDLYNRNPFLIHSINPHVGTAWSYYAERTMANSLLRNVQNANALTTLKPTLADENQMAILDPNGEVGPFYHDEWGLYGATARREFVRFLREVRKLSLNDVSNRYTGRSGSYRNWEDVPLADWRQFYGWADGAAVDLAGEWRFMPDDEQVGFQEGWSLPDFDDSGWIRLYYPGDALLYSLYPHTKTHPLWMRKTFTVDKARLAKPQSERFYLSLAPLSRKSAQVFINGQPAGSLDPNFHTARTYGQFDITDLVKAGKPISVVLRLTDVPNGPIFVTSKKLESFPTSDPLANARRWDHTEFVDWQLAEGVASTLAAIRSVEPDRPIKVHAYGASPWGWKTVAQYGGFSHHTGSGAGWHFTVPKAYGANRGLQHSSEPGGPMGSLRGFKGLWGNLAYMGMSAHDYFINPQSITNDPKKLAYFEQKLPAIKVMGRASVMVSPIGMIRGTLNTKYTGEFANDPNWRYGVTAIRGGEMTPLLDEVRIREGDLNDFKVIIDEGTLCWDGEMVEALQNYVEKGGILVLNSLSGIHTFIDKNKGAGPALAGVELAAPPAKGGAITFTNPDPRFPGLQGELKISGRHGVNGHSLKPLPGTEVLGTWPDGSVAFTRRDLGKGAVYCCAETTYPGSFGEIVAAAFGPETYATKEGGIDLLRTARSNNGCEELLMVRGLGKEATITWTLEEAPERIYDPATGKTIPAEIKGKTATFKVNIPDWDFNWYAARRKGTEKTLAHWLKRQGQIWSGVIEGGKEPKVDLFRHLDLNHGWKLVQTDSAEKARELMKLDDQQAGLKPTELILWDAPGMKTRTGDGVFGFYRNTFDIPEFWRGKSTFALSLKGYILDSKLEAFGGENEVILNEKSIWTGKNLQQEWLDVSELMKPEGNRLEIIHKGNGIMPAIVLVRSAIPETVMDLAGEWHAVEGLQKQKTTKLPGKVKAAFVYRDVDIPDSMKDKEVWLRVKGCQVAIINGRQRYWEMRGVPSYHNSPVYEANITPDIRFGEKNRIVLGPRAWNSAYLDYQKMELCFYKPGEWSAKGDGIRDTLSKTELAAVAKDLATIKAFSLVNAPSGGAEGRTPSSQIDASQPLKLPPAILDLAFNTDKGLAVDRGPNNVPVTVTGTVEPFSEAGGKIKGVYIRGEQKPPGTLSLPGAVFRKKLARKPNTFQVWVKPMEINQRGGSLVNWLSYMFGWDIENNSSTIWRHSSPERKMIVDGLIKQHQWQCLTLVNEGKKGTLYFNGIPVGVQTWPTNFPDADNPLCIGSIQGVRRFINAKLAVFTIYEGALTPDKVARLYLQQQPAFTKDKAYAEDDAFRLKVTQKGAVDGAVLSGKLTLGEGVKSVKEKGKRVLDFDGVASHILLNDHPQNRLFSKPFELVVDFKPEEGARGMIFRRHHMLCLQLLNNGTLRFDANIGRRNWIDFPQAIGFGQWNRVRFRYDGKKASVSVNGKLFGEKDYPGAMYKSSYPISFFADRTYPGFPKAGNIKCKVRELRVVPYKRN
ncbi:MAG: LamG-like jellyroll fold domain-containing protein [Candidatus Omnitrophota bacterium]